MAEMRSKSGKKLTPHFEHFDGGVFDYFCQNYWSQGHQNLPRVSHQGYLQMLFYKKISNSKKIIYGFLIYAVLSPLSREGVMA